jgi:hypothetical protein
MSLSVLDGIVIGVVGGTFAGLAVWIAQLGREYALEKWHKNRIYNWMNKRIHQRGLTAGSPFRSGVDSPWVTTLEIADHTNLPLDRVRYICSLDKRITPLTERELFPKEPLEERWAIREDVNKQEASKENRVTRAPAETRSFATTGAEFFLSRVDQFNTALLAISVFLLGILVNKYDLILSNNSSVYIFTWIIGIILAFIFCFSLGTYAAIEDKSNIRILSWSLVCSCLILITTMPLIVAFGQYMIQLPSLLFTWVLPIVLLIVNILITVRILKRFEKKFVSKGVTFEIYNMKTLLYLVPVPVFVFAVAAIISVYLIFTGIG